VSSSLKTLSKPLYDHKLGVVGMWGDVIKFSAYHHKISLCVVCPLLFASFCVL
jgi:hypothetical protein